MASGRPDYWTRVSPTKVSISPEQILWSLWHTKILAGGTADFFSGYTVNVGYKLIITGGEVSCQNPGINRFALYVRGEIFDYLYFDQLYVFAQDSSGFCELAAGDEIKGYVGNFDNVTNTFIIAYRGYLEEV